MGNNAELARRLGWRVEGCLDGELGEGFLWSGRLAQAQSVTALAEQMANVLQRAPLVIEAPNMGDIVASPGVQGARKT